jgi:pyridoxamine 5'-phosphate oxidase
MKIQDCINFANENPICFLATVEDNQPRVRALGFWYADKTGFYFQTSTTKNFYRHLKENPNTEVCFYRHEHEIGPMLRITGKAEFLNDRKLKEKAIFDRPMLKDCGITADSPGLILFRIASGEARFWTIKNLVKHRKAVVF